MFELNPTELKILEILVQTGGSDSKYDFKGFSTYQMRQNGGMSLANWTKYKDKLLYFQLVSEYYEKVKKPRKPRKSNSKINFPEKFKTRYYVTPVGFLNLLQNLKPQQISDYVSPEYLKFLPLISKHLPYLQDLGFVFYILFKYCIENIDLQPTGTDKINKGEKLKSIMDRQIQEKITLSFMTQQTQMTFSRNFLTLSSAEKVIVQNTAKHLDLPNHTELVNSVSSHLSFLFYFYLMLLLEDNALLYKICSDANNINSNIESKKFSEEIPLDEFKKTANNIVKLGNETVLKLKPLIKKIKKDPEIIELFNSNIEEIESKLLSVDFLEYLSKTMTK